jgi:hypothetical protein
VYDTLHDKFKINNLESTKRLLGMDIQQTENYIQLSQEKYIDKLFNRFQMENAHTIHTPIKNNPTDENGPFEGITKYQTLVGSLIYLSTISRPDITYAISHVSQFMQKPFIQN